MFGLLHFIFGDMIIVFLGELFQCFFSFTPIHLSILFDLCLESVSNGFHDLSMMLFILFFMIEGSIQLSLVDLLIAIGISTKEILFRECKFLFRELMSKFLGNLFTNMFGLLPSKRTIFIELRLESNSQIAHVIRLFFVVLFLIFINFEGSS